MKTQTRTKRLMDERGVIQWDNFLKDFKEIVDFRKDPDYNNYVYHYNGKTYDRVGKSYLERTVANTYGNLSFKQVMKISKWIEQAADYFDKDDVIDASNYIAFRNGIYDIHKKTLIPFDRNLFIRNLIDWDYNPDAESKNVLQMIEDYSNNDDKQRLYILYLFAHCMIANRFGDAGFAIKGETMTGKSKFLHLVEKLIGKDNISFREIGAQYHGKHAYEDLYDRLVNLCYAAPTYGSSEIVHDVIVGNQIYFTREPMSKPAPYSTIVYVADKAPKDRKIHLLTFTKKIDSDDDFDFNDNDMSALINMALAAYYKNGKYLA